MSDTEVQTGETVEQEPPATTETSPEPPDAEHQGDEPEPDTFPRDYVEKLRKEAADRRKERDTLAAQVENLQRQQVDALITSAGVKPPAVWAITNLDALLAEDGTVSPELVNAAILQAREQLGVQPIGKGNIVPGVGGMPNALPNVDRWSEAFTPKRR